MRGLFVGDVRVRVEPVAAAGETGAMAAEGILGLLTIRWRRGPDWDDDATGGVIELGLSGE